MNKINIWKSLAHIYLKDFEIIDTINENKRDFYRNLIKNRLFKDVWKRMLECDEDKPPFLTNKYSKFIRIDRKSEIRETLNEKHAHLELKENRFIIFINQRKSEYEKRTLISHELGHTFLYDVDRLPIRSYIEELTNFQLLAFKNLNYYQREEGMIYEIARHILIPSEFLIKIVPLEPSLEVFIKSCNKENFFTTKSLMAKRLYWDIHDWDLKSKYWDDSILIIYPLSRIQDKIFEPPSGNNEIYRGSKLMSINIKNKIWPWLIPQITLSLKNKNKTIHSEDFISQDLIDPLLIHNCEYISESLFIPYEKCIYSLIFAKRIQNISASYQSSLASFIDNQ